MAFFEESTSSGSLCWLGLSLRCRQSLGHSLWDILCHLPGLIAQCKVVFGLHFEHSCNIVSHPTSPLVKAKCPILLLTDKLKSHTQFLSWFNNINCDVTIGPKGETVFNLEPLQKLVRVRVKCENIQWQVIAWLHWLVLHSRTRGNTCHACQPHCEFGNRRKRVLTQRDLSGKDQSHSRDLWRKFWGSLMLL